ncbi:hypothetical protein M407DRAFT_208365 [Tulasnella calospora MUT 4182]|uniref:Uncharacterized protein n=1 Tax=Tulasnella calospora MUT 4182 TaxID=1051891 RepID=A0A0C3K2I6_9AGAM|nr:hypothetical protein M407DRAFT_208365 [Tulasnella calospora MUT 4182]
MSDLLTYSFTGYLICPSLPLCIAVVCYVLSCSIYLLRLSHSLTVAVAGEARFSTLSGAPASDGLQTVLARL